MNYKRAGKANKREIEGLVDAIAPRFHLPRELVLPIIRVESGWNQWAYNPEPHYRYLVDARTGKPFRKLTSGEARAKKPPADFPSAPALADDTDAEWWGQQASWGLMQVMGAVAREYGFRGWFAELCVPAVGIWYGCTYLGRMRDRFLDEHGWEGVVAAYNAGSPRKRRGEWENQGYVDKVMRRLSL